MQLSTQGSIPYRKMWEAGIIQSTPEFTQNVEAMNFYIRFLCRFLLPLQAFVMPFSLRARVGFVAENWP